MPVITVVPVAASADAVTLGDTATGEVNPAGEVDYFVFSVTGGTSLDIDVDASQFGSPLDPTLELFNTDGLTSLAFNDDFDGLDSRIIFTIDTTGDYFIAIRAFAGGGGPGQTYTINFNTVPPPPPRVRGIPRRSSPRAFRVRGASRSMAAVIFSWPSCSWTRCPA